MVFNRYDAEAIYRIPLSRRCVPDVMVWLHKKNRQYSVKSGYHIARILLKESSQEGEGSIPRSSCKVWARIWKLHIPNKIKVIGWQACHNILPTYERLWHKRIIENNVCPICKHFPEMTIHALWECAAAQDVWAGCSYRTLQKGRTDQATVMHLFENLMHKLPEDVLEFFLVQSWLIWHQRNRVVHGGILQ